jgi:glyoxylase-like metal-dependent hydrolase (beta-lactamase superfamily II)
MKRFAVLSAIVAVGLGTALYAQGVRLPPPEPIEKVGDNLYKIFGGGGNTTVFVRDDGVVLVDTKLGGNGQAILDEVRKITDLPVTLIINTHSHGDHTGSNNFFTAADSKVEVVMHENAAAQAAKPAFGEPALATSTYADRKTLGSGRNQIDLYYFGAGHTNGDSFVVFPSERAMSIGDIMAWDMGAVIDTGAGGSALAMPETLDKAAATLGGKIDRVIEGHGKVDDWQTFLGYKAYTHKIVEVAKLGVAESLNYVQAYDKYFATDPAMAAYTGEGIMKGLEYGGTPKSRTLNNLFIAMKQLKGETVPLTMGAPPPP